MARGRKLTRKMVDRARQMAAEFRTDKEIYTALGIAESTFYLYKADKEDAMCVAFSEALEKGHEEYLQSLERECLARIRRDDSWQSDAWILERTMPEKYGRLDRLQATLDADMRNDITIEVRD